MLAIIGSEDISRNLNKPKINFLFFSLLLRNVSQLLIVKFELAAHTTPTINALWKFKSKIDIRVYVVINWAIIPVEPTKPKKLSVKIG